MHRPRKNCKSLVNKYYKIPNLQSLQKKKKRNSQRMTVSQTLLQVYTTVSNSNIIKQRLIYYVKKILRLEPQTITNNWFYTMHQFHSVLHVRKWMSSHYTIRRRSLWFDESVQSMAPTIISYRRFNQPRVDVVDAFEAFQPRSLSACHQPHRMCELTIG